jgi:hypothetical protein
VHKFGGVHGLAILVKNSISDYVTVLEETTSNCVLWLHIKQEVLGREVIIGGCTSTVKDQMCMKHHSLMS